MSADVADLHLMAWKSQGLNDTTLCHTATPRVQLQDEDIDWVQPVFATGGQAQLVEDDLY